MMIRSKSTSNCRLCNSKNLVNFVNFGKVAIGNNLLNSKKKSLNTKKFPLKVKRCKNCNHFQLSYQVSPKILYTTNYTYLSGVAPSFKKHLATYSNWIIKKCNLKKNNLVLDIGSNDGTCLEEFKKNNFNVLGVDPANLPAKIANKKGITTLNNFFDMSRAKKILKKYGKIDFITSHNVLAHISKNQEVFKGIYYILKDEGYFCFEVGYFFNVLKKNYFDTIYHEHLDYHHASPLVKFLKKIGFSIILIKTNKIQGGSLRILCKKEKKSYVYKQPKNFLKKERKSIIFNKIFLSKWEENIYKNCLKLNNFINHNISLGHKFIGYGAPTKATLLSKLSKLDGKLMKFTLEDNIKKINKYIPGTDIKILNSKNIKFLQPDFLLLFAWNFYSDIVSNLKKKLKKSKVFIVLPSPKLKVIKL